MKASEARRLTAAVNHLTHNVDERIREAIDLGLYATTIAKTSDKKLIKELKDDGYQVSHNDIYTFISWLVTI
jgi:hypothetical protein